MANAQNVNIIKDVSTVTRVPQKILDDLTTKECLCIGSAIYEAKLDKKEAVILSIGIGTLSVDIATGQCKFVPSRELKSTIKTCLTKGIDPLQLVLEEAVRAKLLNIYQSEV